MLVTVSGLPGSGTSTVARRVASALGLGHVDGGTVFRSYAAERGLTLAELGARAESDPSIDRELDDRLAHHAIAGGIVLESRLAGWLAARSGCDGLRVWITCDPDERARRVAARDGHEADEARRHNDEREASERRRYLDYYGIDLTDLSVYDLVVDSTTRGPDELAEEIVTAAREM